MVNYHQFLALDRPYLSCNDHHDRWVFQDIFYYYCLEILLSDLELVLLEFKHLQNSQNKFFFICSFFIHYFAIIL